MLQSIASLARTVIGPSRVARIGRILKRYVLRPRLLYLLAGSTTPVSNWHGFDRGTPIDRFYIDSFLTIYRSDIRGRCLEFLNANYCTRLAPPDAKIDVIDIDRANPNANIYDDLRNAKSIEANTYDFILLTQVLQFIDDLDSAISECKRILKPGGVALVTLPSLSRIDPISGGTGDFWRFTVASAKYLFSRHFPAECIQVRSEGNIYGAMSFLAGFSVEDVSLRKLAVADPNFPTLITVRVVKPL